MTEPGITWLTPSMNVSALSSQYPDDRNLAAVLQLSRRRPGTRGSRLASSLPKANPCPLRCWKYRGLMPKGSRHTVTVASPRSRIANAYMPSTRDSVSRPQRAQAFSRTSVSLVDVKGTPNAARSDRISM